MKRRNFILGGGALLTVSGSISMTSASVAESVSSISDFRVVPAPPPRTLAADPSTENTESVHTWTIEFTSNETVASITANYDFGTETISFDGLTSDEVTVEFRQDGSYTPIAIDPASYSGPTATFDLTDTDTTATLGARVTIGTPETGLVNPGDGSYTPTLTFEAESGETETYEAELSVRVNDTAAVDVSKPVQNQRFTALPDGEGNVFELSQVDIRDDDGDADLVEVNYDVREGGTGGIVVAQKTVSFAESASYQPSTSPAETIQPDDGYSIRTDQTYTLTTSGEDADGNTASSTVQDTTSGGNTKSAVRVDKPTKDQSFTANPPQGNSGNTFEIKQVQVKDRDGDADITEVDYEVYEGGTSGPTVAKETVDVGPTDQYQEKKITIQPNAGESIEEGQLYTLVFTVTDADGNFAQSTVQNTA